MRNPDKDETLSLSAVLSACEHRKVAAETGSVDKHPRSDGEQSAYALARRLKAAWTAFKTRPARRAAR